MLKTILLSFACSVAAATATAVYVGRTVISSPFQMNIPYNSGVKVAQDPANVWSWHHDFHALSGAVTVNALVDVDGNGVMDTEYDWLRVVVTDIQLVSRSNCLAIATISDGTGKRYSIGTAGDTVGGGAMPANVANVALSTPIVLPVNGALQVTVENLMVIGDFEVNLIGRVVNL